MSSSNSKLYRPNPEPALEASNASTAFETQSSTNASTAFETQSSTNASRAFEIQSSTNASTAFESQSSIPKRFDLTQLILYAIL